MECCGNCLFNLRGKEEEDQYPEEYYCNNEESECYSLETDYINICPEYKNKYD